jgi:porin
MKAALSNGRVVLAVLALTASAGVTRAQNEPPPDYSGDIWTRPTLTGDWGGLRNDWAKKGMTFDLSATQVEMGVLNGGRQEHWHYAGRWDFVFNLDTQKAGLWPGGFFTLEAEGNWGSKVNRDAGAISPVDSNDIYPLPGDNNPIELPEVSYAQFLSPHLGFFVGKVATLTSTSGDMNEFAHGKGDDNFMNLAFNINPAAVLIPYSALAAGVIILPGKTPHDAIVTLSVLDAEGSPGTTGFNTVFDGGTLYSAEGRVRTDFFGRTGHQLLGGAYSDKLYTSLNQDFRFIVENRALRANSNAWSVYYNFDQYLYEPVKGSGKGLGVFGRFGATDDAVLPVKFFWSIGVGGKGMIPGRPNDNFGIGYYDLITSNAGIPSRLGINDEWGVEAFYNVAVTPWAMFTVDLQYVEGALPRSDDALVLGARLKVRF